MGENYNNREDILKLLYSKIITVADAIFMLKNLDEEVANQKIEQEIVEQKAPEKTFDERISEIAEEAFNDFADISNNLQEVLEIMKRKNWVYLDKPVTYESVKEMIIKNTKYAISHAVEQNVKSNGRYSRIYSGGFEVTAMCCDDPEEDVIEIDIKFIPYEGFGNCNLSEMKKLHIKSNE